METIVIVAAWIWVISKIVGMVGGIGVVLWVIWGLWQIKKEDRKGWR